MIPAPAALARLREGNQRFVAGASNAAAALGHVRRAELAVGQRPFAAVLGCSDSRVPAELVLGQGFGDLFVIRVAGNVVAPSLLGSVEFAAARFGVRLVVVLGHTDCGAVTAAVEELRRPGAAHPEGLRDILERIRPAVESLVAAAPGADAATVIAQAVRANVRAAAAQLRSQSSLLTRLIQTAGLLVVGAEYSLRTGVVDFFDGADAAALAPPARAAGGAP